MEKRGDFQEGDSSWGVSGGQDPPTPLISPTSSSPTGLFSMPRPFHALSCLWDFAIAVPSAWSTFPAVLYIGDLFVLQASSLWSTPQSGFFPCYNEGPAVYKVTTLQGFSPLILTINCSGVGTIIIPVLPLKWHTG